MNQVELSIVVAVYNESEHNLHVLIERLANVLASLGASYEIVFVNDGSGGETTSCLNEHMQQLDYVKLICLSRNFGQQAAISAGIHFAAGKAIITMDSDLQDPPELIPDMVRLWCRGFDVVYAKRSSRKDRLGKRLTAYLFYLMMSLLSSTNIPRDTGEFRLIDKRVADALKRLPERTRYIRGLIPWLGFRQTTVPVDRHARQHGESAYTLRKLITLAFDGMLCFSHAPLYAISAIGMLTILVSFFIPLLSLMHGNHQLSAAMIVSAFVFLIGLQFVLLGIVALYVARIFDEVRARPVYVVSKIGGRAFAVDREKTRDESRTVGMVIKSQEDYEFDANPAFLTDYHEKSDYIAGQNTNQVF